HPGRLSAGGAEIEEVFRRLCDLPGKPDRRAEQRDAQNSRDDERQGFEPAFLRLRTAGVFDEFLRHRTPAYGQIPTGRWTQRPATAGLHAQVLKAPPATVTERTHRRRAKDDRILR